MANIFQWPKTFMLFSSVCPLLFPLTHQRQRHRFVVLCAYVASSWVPDDTHTRTLLTTKIIEFMTRYARTAAVEW